MGALHTSLFNHIYDNMKKKQKRIKKLRSARLYENPCTLFRNEHLYYINSAKSLFNQIPKINFHNFSFL